MRKFIISLASGISELVFLIVLLIGAFGLYKGEIGIILIALAAFVSLSLMFAAFFCLVEIAENSRKTVALLEGRLAVRVTSDGPPPMANMVPPPP